MHSLIRESRDLAGTGGRRDDIPPLAAIVCG